MRKFKLGRTLLLIGFYIIIGLIIIISTKKIHFEENISALLPANKENEFLHELLDSAAFFDRIIVHINLVDTTRNDPDILISVANDLSDSVEKKFIPSYITQIEGKADFLAQYKLLESFYKYLPLYLENSDYRRLDSMIANGNFDKMLQEYIKALNSPAGMIVSRFMFRDPFGLATRQISRLKALQVNENLIFYQSYLFTADKKNLLFFLNPNDVSNTSRDAEFVKQLNSIISSIKDKNHNLVSVEYLGSLPAAAANATQIKKDINLTVSIASVIIILLIYYFFRRKSNLLLILIPAAIGISIALVVFAAFKIKVSAISMGMGSVLLAISVDYALHLLTHLKHSDNVAEVVKKVAGPALVGSLTTALAFLLMMLLSSPALRQLGLFAAITIFTSALAAVFILPFFTSFNQKEFVGHKITLIEKLAGIETGHNTIKMIVLVSLTCIFFYFSGNASIEKDIEKSNFMPPALKKTQQNLDKISQVNKKSIYLLSSGHTVNEALLNSEANNASLDSLKKANEIGAYYGVQSLIFSKDRQQAKIEVWNNFWTKKKIDFLKDKLTKAAISNHFKPAAFNEFYGIIERPFTPVPPDSLFAAFSELTGNFCIKLHDRVLIASVIWLNNPDKETTIENVFRSRNSAYLLDKKNLYQKMFETVQSDFNTLLNLTMFMVLFVILLYLGRIETTIITFLPIFLSWYWVLGIIGFIGLKLNYFNIIICSVIFGLGVDYSIYITDGLTQKYKYGNNDLVSNKSSIIISILSIITGLGVLVFAKHPALRSIAVLSVIGLVIAVVISLTMQPVLFRFLTESNGKKRPRPVEFYNLLLSLIIFGSFGIFSFVITGLLPIFYIFPAKKSRKRYVLRAIVGKGCRFIMALYHRAGIDWVGIDKHSFDEPAVIISNHSSMVDILIFLSMSPRIIMLTKDWIWKNPFFGLVVRYCGHINISEGYDNVLETIRERATEGCSMVVFPEGSRSDTGNILRFHKGAFYLAQHLNLPMQTFLIHGIYDVLPRGTFILSPGRITVTRSYSFRINHDDPRAYYYASKETCIKMRKNFQELKKELETPYYLRHRIFSNYLYKGPIIENYIKIKLRIEKYYEVFDRLIPDNAVITDIGCGYGPMTFMLSLRSPDREIFAIDYDEEKIDLARCCEIASHCNITFEAADALEYDLPSSDVFLISDMLHYLPSVSQKILLKRCIDKLKPCGQIIIRDADRQPDKKHQRTVFTEFLSTRIGFNKTTSKLSFFSRNFIEEIANNNEMDLTIIANDKLTSNKIYVFKKKPDELKK